MRKTSLILSLVVLASVSLRAGADEIVSNGVSYYRGVQIISFKGLTVLFEMSGSGSLVSKSILDISSMKITGQDSFNQAEQDFARGKFAEAVKNYDIALDRASNDWLKGIIQIRRIVALDNAGMVDRSVKEWLKIVDEFQGGKIGLVFKPKKVADKGSKANNDAIAALEAKVGKVKQPEYIQAINQVLLALYTAQDNAEKASQIADELAGKRGGAAFEDNQGSVAVVPSAGSLSSRLKGAAAQINTEPAKALKNLQANLKSYSSTELPSALLLMGKAQIQLRQKSSDNEQKQKLLLDAGLNFMRVFTFFNATDEANEALYEAGLVNVELGNKPAAKMAFKTVIDRGANGQVGKKAATAIGQLEK